MNTTRVIALSVASFIFAGITGCAQDVPYRDLGFKADIDAATCEKLYKAYDTGAPEGDYPQIDGSSPCWRRSHEKHDVYDLLSIEFDDQGWVQGASDLPLSQRNNFMDDFMKQLDRLYKEQREQNNGGLSLVVFVHGWHHSAAADDRDVHAFRRVLRQIAQMEENLAKAKYTPMRVVGIYIGWRGEAIPIPLLRGITFWDRKNAAQRVAYGSVRDLLGRLDHFREVTATTTNDKKTVRNVRMLTIGHSFGGLIVFESLSSDFVRNSVRYRKGEVEHGVSRVGDLVVIVNPAFEGIRYEPVRVASVRLEGLDETQLPALIIATSEGDWATKVAFPLARTFSTYLEIEKGDQRTANTRTIGHNSRFTTHYLSEATCTSGDCSKACEQEAPAPQKLQTKVQPYEIGSEFRLMRRIQREGVKRTEYLCNNLKLEATERWEPERNPYWVVQTKPEVIADHGDIFNPKFVAFLRQMYLGFIFAVTPEPRR
jgi:hypothetical protein